MAKSKSKPDKNTKQERPTEGQLEEQSHLTDDEISELGIAKGTELTNEEIYNAGLKKLRVLRSQHGYSIDEPANTETKDTDDEEVKKTASDEIEDPRVNEKQVFGCTQCNYKTRNRDIKLCPRHHDILTAWP